MSTRYIWTRCEYELRYYWDYYLYPDGDNGIWVQESYNSSRDRLFGMTEQPSLDSSTGKITYDPPSDGARVIGSSTYSIDTNDYPWVLYATVTGSQWSSSNPDGSSSISTYKDTIVTPLIDKINDDDNRYILLRRHYTNTDWKFWAPLALNYELYVRSVSSSTGYDFYVYNTTESPMPSSIVGYVSSRSSSAYPGFDIDDDGYFYYAEDQDIIDPDSVIIPDVILYDSDITITINPSDDAINNTYGNITYVYQYKFNDTSWETLETTANTTASLHIPSGKTSVQVRVQAKDDIGFTSSSYIVSDEVSISASNPPTAPSFITVDRTVEGFLTTVTIGEATDSDGTISSYVIERKTQNGSWTQVQNSLEQTFTEYPDGSWITVQYRAYAIDNSGTKSQYITSESYEIVTDLIIIMGPTRHDFGIKLSNFTLTFYVIVAGDSTASDISVNVDLDEASVFSETADVEEILTVPISISGLSYATHTITITAYKEGYTMASEVYTFKIEGLTLPEGGNAVQFQDSTGKAVIPISRAECILFDDGRSLKDVIESIISQSN